MTVVKIATSDGQHHRGLQVESNCGGGTLARSERAALFCLALGCSVCLRSHCRWLHKSLPSPSPSPQPALLPVAPPHPPPPEHSATHSDANELSPFGPVREAQQGPSSSPEESTPPPPIGCLYDFQHGLQMKLQKNLPQRFREGNQSGSSRIVCADIFGHRPLVIPASLSTLKLLHSLGPSSRPGFDGARQRSGSEVRSKTVHSKM